MVWYLNCDGNLQRLACNNIRKLKIILQYFLVDPNNMDIYSDLKVGNKHVIAPFAGSSFALCLVFSVSIDSVSPFCFCFPGSEIYWWLIEAYIYFSWSPYST